MAVFMNRGRSPELPYIELKSIKSTGTQYINTQFYPKYNSRVVIEISDLPGGNSMIFGTRDSNSATAAQQFNAYRQGSTAIRSDYFGTNKSVNVSNTTKRTIIDKNANIMTAYGLTITNTAVSSGECSNSLFLFALNNCGTPNSFASYTFYSSQIYDGVLLVRDYIPVQMRNSGEIGLWDKLFSRFYPNVGTGVFIAGEVAA
jgi:hypothetical protein